MIPTRMVLLPSSVFGIVLCGAPSFATLFRLPLPWL